MDSNVILVRYLSEKYSFYVESGIYIESNISSFNQFEREYLHTRKKEGRLLSDEQVSKLPKFEGNASLVKEWGVRNESAEAFLSYLSKKPSVNSILDIGCGNGWFTHLIANNCTADVVGVDVNRIELLQAHRVFNGVKNLIFCSFDLYSSPFNDNSFDLIIVNSAIQYFSDFHSFVSVCRRLLKSGGELHIIDSPIYLTATDALSAKSRSTTYYTSLDASGMDDFYFHHTTNELKNYDWNWLYNPEVDCNDIRPFPWIRLIN